MLTVQDFLDAGYRICPQHSLRNSDYLVQKQVTDEVGTKYFIHICVYEWFKKSYYTEDNFPKPIGFMPEVQFQRGDESTMNVTLILDDKSTIQKIEKEFECLWLFLEKPYYSKYME